MIEQTLHYGELRIPYAVHFVAGKKRSVAIHVRPDGSVRVDAPAGLPLSDIKRVALRRARWIAGHLERCRQLRQHVLPREYVSGETHYYLGKRYLLKIRENARGVPGVKLLRGELQVSTRQRQPDVVCALLLNWYRLRAMRVFEHRLTMLCGQLPWRREAPRWRLRNMNRQWGSCSPGGVLTLNPQLVKAPARCIDYVLLHELCHLKHHDHSVRFYRLLTRHMPDWNSVKARLDNMAELLLNS